MLQQGSDTRSQTSNNHSLHPWPLFPCMELRKNDIMFSHSLLTMWAESLHEWWNMPDACWLVLLLLPFALYWGQMWCTRYGTIVIQCYSQVKCVASTFEDVVHGLVQHPSTLLRPTCVSQLNCLYKFSSLHHSPKRFKKKNSTVVLG